MSVTPSLHQNPCAVCKSQYREHYESMYDQDNSLAKVELESKNKGDNEGRGFSKGTFSTHFKWRQQKIDDNTPDSVKKAAEFRIMESINLLTDLQKNLSNLKDMSDNMFKDMQKTDLDPKLLRAWTDMLKEMRLLVKDIAEVKQELRIKPDVDEEAVVKRLRYCLQDLSSKDLESVLVRLKEQFNIVI